MNEEIQDIIETIDSYMDKKQLDLNSKHNLSKLMTENYWEEIKDDGEGEDLTEDDLLDEFDELEKEKEDDNIDFEEQPKKKVNINNMIKKSNSKIKKPQIKIK